MCSKLTEHELMHTGENIYLPHVQKVVFVIKLVEHELIHTREKHLTAISAEIRFV